MTSRRQFIATVAAVGPLAGLRVRATEDGRLVTQGETIPIAGTYDLVVGNDVTARGSGFGTNTNRVTFVTPDGRVQHLPLMSKLAVARRIVSFAESAVAERPPYQSTAAKRKGANA